MPHNIEEIIQQKAKELHRYMNGQLPRTAKNLGLQFFQSRFRSQGWLDESFQPWPKRKKQDKRRPGRNILIDRGRLRNSLRGQINVGTGDISVVFGTDVPYAKIHNEGGTIRHPGGERVITHRRYTRGQRKGRSLFARNNRSATWSRKVNVGPYDIKMPKRQFMGKSAHLNRIIQRKIENDITNILK